MKKNIFIYSVLAIFLSLAGCVKDYSDPSKVTDDKIANTKGLTAIAVGLQSRYVNGRGNLYNIITASGFLTGEFILLNQGNTAELQLSQGGTSIDGSNTNLSGLWSNSTKIMYDANTVLSNIGTVADKGTASGILGYTTIFKALAVGDLCAYWEKIPAGTGNNVTFITRAEGYTKIISEIDAALAAITANPISAAFLTNIPGGINIPNTLNALKARYALYSGNNTLALTTANSVDLAAKSSYTFTTLNPNPIFTTVTSPNNLYQPVDNKLGLPAGIQPDAADKRIPFYVVDNFPAAVRWGIKGFAASQLGEWPVYLPGEITLIKAEVYARQGGVTDLANSLIELNKIVTKKPVADPYGVGADLPPLIGPLTQAQLLTEVYKQRQIELYMFGQRLEDSRRLGRPAAERKRTYLPYPFRERDQNPNTPADPAL